jgi:hypothetical protein
MKFRIAANAGFAAALGNTPFKIENQTNTTVDLEVEFTTRRPTTTVAPAGYVKFLGNLALLPPPLRLRQARLQ